jgi:hypothetical protein
MPEALPSVIRQLSSIRFGRSSNSQVFRSPLSGSTQTEQLTGGAWTFTYNLLPQTRAEAQEWMVFLLKLNGMSGRFYGHDPSNAIPQGTIPGTPLIKGASQTGQTLETDGWTASQTGILLAGDAIAYDTATITTGPIATFADYSGTVSGTVKVTDVAHDLATNDRIRITGTTNYNGLYTITVIDDDNFYITHSWDGNDATGTWTIAWRERYVVASDVDSDGSGNASIPLTHPIRSSPVDNDPLIASTASCVMRLLTDDEAHWDVQTALRFGFSFSAVEVPQNG